MEGGGGGVPLYIASASVADGCRGWGVGIRLPVSSHASASSASESWKTDAGDLACKSF